MAHSGEPCGPTPQSDTMVSLTTSVDASPHCYRFAATLRSVPSSCFQSGAKHMAAVTLDACGCGCDGWDNNGSTSPHNGVPGALSKPEGSSGYNMSVDTAGLTVTVPSAARRLSIIATSD